MYTIKMLTTGEVREVTPNVAHGLVERGEAVMYGANKQWYKQRQMVAGSPVEVEPAKEDTLDTSDNKQAVQPNVRGHKSSSNKYKTS